MDELIHAPGEPSALAKARNRLATVLFTVSVFVTLSILLVDATTRDFASKEKQLLNTHQRWAAIKLRSIEKTIRPAAVVEAGIIGLLLSPCLRQAEYDDVMKMQLSAGASTSYWGRRKHACQAGFRPYVLSVEVAKVAETMKSLLESRTEGDTALLSALYSRLHPAHAMIIKSHYSDAQLIRIVREWATWSLQRKWLLDPELKYEPDRNSEGGVSWKVWFSDSSYIAPDFSRKGLERRLVKTSVSADDRIDEDRLAAARTESDGERVIEEAYSRAASAHANHTIELAVNQLQLGGISIAFTRIQKLALPVVAGLLLLFMLYAEKARGESLLLERKTRKTVSSFWFPRLDQPADPFAMPWPIGIEVGARAIWLLFIGLPLGLAFFAVWGNFDTDVLVKGQAHTGQGALSDWASLLFFCVIWWSTITITSTSEFKSKKEQRWFIGAAIGACLLSFLIGMSAGASITFFDLGSAEMNGVNKWISFPRYAWSWSQSPAYLVPLMIWLIPAFRRAQISRFAVASALGMTFIVVAGFSYSEFCRVGCVR